MPEGMLMLGTIAAEGCDGARRNDTADCGCKGGDSGVLGRAESAAALVVACGDGGLEPN